ncbi:MAG: NAD(P)H-binding protein [Rhodobacteraceae bacterium]|nr:NAD(P)H-binding protein [Paracoccaceae bacterium]
MIIVPGATGHLGRAIVEQLVNRIPAHQVGASVRDPEKAADLEARRPGPVTATSMIRTACGALSMARRRC